MSRPAVVIGDFPSRTTTVEWAIRLWTGVGVLIEHVSDGASFTYRFLDSSGERKYLRLMPPGWHSPAEVQGELAFIEHLHAAGIPLVRAVPSLAGNGLEEVDSSIGMCVAVVFEEAAGNGEDDVFWSLDQARAAGQLMARMHIAAQDFVLPAGTERPDWRDEFEILDERLPVDELELRAAVREISRRLEHLPMTRDVYGMVHFDLSGDNLIWNDHKPTVIDFDDCMSNWYVADITRSAGYFRQEGMATHESEFVAGYESVRAIDQAWRDLLPTFMNLALLSELAWMLAARRAGGTGDEFTPVVEANLRRHITAT